MRKGAVFVLGIALGFVAGSTLAVRTDSELVNECQVATLADIRANAPAWALPYLVPKAQRTEARRGR